MAKEQFANNAVTTLSAGIVSVTATTVLVASVTDFPSEPQFRIKINAELMLVTAVSPVGFSVERGIEGTIPAFHSLGDEVTHILTAESFDVGVKEKTRENAFAYGLDVGFTDNAYVLNLDPPLTEYNPGMIVSFKANSSNTGACTLEVDGLDVLPIRKNGTIALRGGEIDAAQIITVIHDGDGFQLISNPDEFCRVRSDDGAAGYLEDKIEAGPGLITVVDESDPEHLKLIISLSVFSPGTTGNSVYSLFGSETGTNGLGGTLENVDRYLIDADVWAHRTGFTAREKSVSASFDGYGYVVYGDFGTGNHKYVDSSDSWTIKTSGISTARTDAASFRIETEKFNVMGGFSSPSNVYRDNFQYNENTDSWSTRQEISAGHGRYAHVGFSIDDENEGYVVGGFLESLTRTSELDLYNNTTNVWTSLAPHGDTNRSNAVGISDGDDLVLYFSGVDSSGTTNDVNRFSKTLANWINDTPGPFGIGSAASGNVSSTNGLIFSGYETGSENVRLNLVAKFTFSYSVKTDIPQPGRREHASFAF